MGLYKIHWRFPKIRVLLDTAKIRKIGRFLENYFYKKGQHISFRLKNANESTKTVWRYHHYKSWMDYPTKRATILSALRKVDIMASDEYQRYHSAKSKIKEFLDLQYPAGILRYMCAVVARDSGHLSWMMARLSIWKHRLLPVPTTTSCTKAVTFGHHFYDHWILFYPSWQLRSKRRRHFTLRGISLEFGIGPPWALHSLSSASGPTSHNIHLCGTFYSFKDKLYLADVGLSYLGKIMSLFFGNSEK